MLHRLKKITWVGIIIAVLVPFSQLTTASENPTLDRVIAKGELRVGMSGSQPPFNVVSRDGKLIGLEVDLAEALAGAMGVELKIVTKPFGDLLAALHKDEVDIVISGLSITPERAQKASFIGPYMLSGKSILTKSSVLAAAEDSVDFNRENLTLAALRNSTSQTFIERNLPEATLLQIGDYDEGVKLVMDGKADALVADMAICKLSVLRHPNAGLTTLNRPMTVEPIAMAVSPKDHQFKNVVETYMGAFERTGMLSKLRKKWFEDSAWVVALP